VKFAVEHAFNRLPLPEVTLSDRSYFIWLDSAIPNFLWQDEQHWAIATLSEATTGLNLHLSHCLNLQCG
jgi:hypothetical protein